MPSNELPSPWREFLLAVGSQLSQNIEVHCLGGFVLTVVYGISRSTGDIDYLTAVPIHSIAELENAGGHDSALARRYRIHFQHVGGVPDVPENYDERLVKLELKLSRLQLLILDPYDLCLSKLTRNSPKDREDVKALANKQQLNFSILMDRYSKEMQTWLPNRERHELTLQLWREYFLE